MQKIVDQLVESQQGVLTKHHGTRRVGRFAQAMWERNAAPHQKAASVPRVATRNFDEGMNDLANADLPPNVHHLQHVQNDTPLPAETAEISAPTFGFTLQPFYTEKYLQIPVSCDNPTFGF